MALSYLKTSNRASFDMTQLVRIATSGNTHRRNPAATYLTTKEKRRA
jgi:hypothetical protein